MRRREYIRDIKYPEMIPFNRELNDYMNKENIIKIDIHKYDSIRYKQMEFELEDERKYN